MKRNNFYIPGIPACFSIILLLATVISFSCSKKKADPCLIDYKCADCTCLFEKLQQNLNNAEKAMKIQECYDKVCK